MNHTLVPDELDVLVELLPTPGTRVIELGCGGARMARQMLQRWPDMRYLGLEVDLRQHAINLQDTPPRMRFAVGGAQRRDLPEGAGRRQTRLSATCEKC